MLEGVNFTLDFYDVVKDAYLHVVVPLLVVGTECKYCFKKSMHGIKNILKSWKWIKGTFCFSHFSSENYVSDNWFCTIVSNMGRRPQEKIYDYLYIDMQFCLGLECSICTKRKSYNLFQTLYKITYTMRRKTIYINYSVIGP